MTREFPLDQEGFNPFAAHIGLTFTAVEGGYSQCELEVTEQLKNPHDVLSGGVLYTMADFGMGAAIYPTLDENELPSTVDVTINYFRPVETGSVTCETALINRSQSLAYFESTLYNEKKVAHATGTFFIAKN
ncbi:PaaI family thioesterase [Natronomonas sp.]|uniref:PaaI family thioesterase n=1 Tax=Natronomonas sp. TaxID=2184060 RepID=UPI002FC367D5